MSGRRGVALAGLLLLTAGCSVSAEDYPPVRARYFNLPAGKAQISVSSPDKHDVVVRWRDRDGAWGKRQVVHSDAGRMLTAMRIRVGGPTLAMFATFTPPDTYYDDEIPSEKLQEDDVTTFIVCTDGSCRSSRKYTWADYEPPQVTPDGAHALLADVDGSYIAWHGDDIVELRPSGLPEGAYGARQPLLATDGSLRAVRGAPVDGGCDLTLLTTESGEASFSEAARVSRPGRHRGGCATSLEAFAPDYVVASHSKYDAAFFARTGTSWASVAQDPSGQVRYPRPGKAKLAGAFARTGYWHWRDSVLSSPDGRTLVAQLHFPGEERWGPPQVVARAPQGSKCIFIDPMPTYRHGEEDPFYANLRCRSRPSAGAAWVYSYPTAVTDDGKTWHSFLATDSGLRVGRDMLFRGHPSYRWTPKDGLKVVSPPVPPGSVVTLLDDKTLALSTLVESADGCEVEVRLAAIDATTWSGPVRSTAAPLRAGLCTFRSVQGEKRNVYHYLGEPQGHRMVVLVWRDGVPQLQDSPN